MQTTKVTGIIVRAVDFAEQDKMLTVITPQDEKAEIRARGANKQNSRFMGACAPFCYANFVCNVKGGRLTLSQIEVLDSYFELREDVKRLSAGAVMLTFLEKGAVSNAQGLFELCLYSLSFLCYSPSNPDDLLLCFLVKAMTLMGYRIPATKCSICHASTFHKARFDSVHGALCQNCAKGRGTAIDPLSLEAIYRLNKLPLTDMTKAVLPPETAQTLLEVLPDYCRRHLESNLDRLSYYISMRSPASSNITR